MYTVARGRAPWCGYIDDAIILGGFPWCCTQSLRIGSWWGLNKLVEITISKEVLALITKQLNELTANMNLDLASSCPCWLAKPWWRENASSSRMICRNTSSGTHFLVPKHLMEQCLGISHSKSLRPACSQEQLSSQRPSIVHASQRYSKYLVTNSWALLGEKNTPS